MSFLLDVNGDVEVPVSAAKALAAIDELMFLRFMSGPIPYWAICRRFPQGDPMWARVQCGELPAAAAFTIVDMLPSDCSVNDIEYFIAAKYERVTDPEKQAAEQLAGVEKQNKANQAAIKEDFLKEQEEQTARTSAHELRVSVGADTANAQIVVPKAITPKKKK